LTAWQWLSVSLALAGSAIVAVVAVRLKLNLKRDFFFLFYFLSAVVYTEVAPAAALVEPQRPLTLVVLGVSPAQLFARQYIELQVYALALFALPFAAMYLARPRNFSHRAQIRVRNDRAIVFSIAVALFGTVFLALAIRYDIFYIRLGEAIAARIVALPFVPYVVIRTFEECATFLIGISVFLVALSTGTARAVAFAGLLVTMAIVGSFAMINSRSLVILMTMLVLGWYLHFLPPKWAHKLSTLLPRLVAAALVAGYAVLVVINVRNQGFDGTFHPSYLNPLTASPFGDGQGVFRLNCIDLMARLDGPIERQGPALGAAWQGTYWIIGRFIDPAGFDQVRLAMTTTSKSYLMQQYLHWAPPDYFSCTLTDLFGNFHVIGFLIGGLTIGAFFRFYRHSINHPTTAAAVIIAIFGLTHVIVFDQEASTLLFGWFKKLPVLLAVLAYNPFIVRRLD